VETARFAVLLAGVFPYEISLQLDAATFATRAGRNPKAAILLRRAARAQLAADDRRLRVSCCSGY